MANEKDTVVISSGGNGAGWFVAGILMLALIVFGVLAYNGYFNKSDTISVELKVPEVPAPSGN